MNIDREAWMEEVAIETTFSAIVESNPMGLVATDYCDDFSPECALVYAMFRYLRTLDANPSWDEFLRESLEEVIAFDEAAQVQGAIKS